MAPQTAPARILIVEDNEATATLQRRTLERAGFEVVISGSAEEALETIRQERIDLVLLDNRLPGRMSGIEFLPTLRTLAPDLPVVMVTGSETQGTVASALRGGVRDFVRKEIDYLTQLPKTVSNVLKNASLEAQVRTQRASNDCPVLIVSLGSGAEVGDAATLKNTGFQKFTARGTDEALNMLAEHEIALLLIDAAESPSAGVDAYRRLQDAGYEIPAVLTSANADDTVLIEAIRAGFINFVPKTADYEPVLLEAVNRAAERLCLEARLTEFRTRLSGIVNSAMDAILLLDARHRIVLFNPAAERLFQIPAVQALDQPIGMFIPELQDRLSGAVAALNSQRHISARGLRNQAKDAELEVALTGMETAGRPFFTVIARDVTERNELERRLLQKDKLESLGLLAGGIAHDFNNLLVGIMGNASLALETISSSNPARTMLKDVLLASETAANLTRQLLAYAGKGRFVTEPVDLSDLVQQISALLQTTIPKNVQLRHELMARLPCVEADLSQMQQVMMNLVINASEAIGTAPGTILITTSVQQVDEDYIAAVLLPAQIVPGEYVTLQVHDSGPGMTQEVLDRIFDPFFTTKFTGRGLGLAAALGIVRGHRGAIKVYSTPGQGTTFKLLFPATAQQSTKIPQVIADRKTASGETVLVVDDEQIVRKSAKAMLERHGYSVVLAENGKEAVELFRILGDRIDAVLLDMTMPEMNGEESFRHLKTMRPDVRVILSSGYNEVEAVRRFSGKGLAGFLQKPYSTLTLVNKIQAVLNEAKGDGETAGD